MRYTVMLIIAAASAMGYADAVDLGLCECGAFSKSSISAGEEPLMVQHAGMRVGCGAEGATMCKKQCMKKYDAVKDAGEFANLCDGVKHLERMTVSVFSRACQKEPWSYSGVTFLNPVCCHDGATADCDNLLPDATADEIDEDTWNLLPHCGNGFPGGY